MNEVQDHALERALGKEIAAWRARRGLTQKQVAVAMNIGVNTLGRWESGETAPDVAETMRLARILNAPLSEIIEKALQEEPKYRVPAEPTQAPRGTERDRYTLAAKRGEVEPEENDF